MNNFVLTRNIDSVLKEYATSTYTHLYNCDFNLLSVVTYIKYANEDTYTKIPNELYKKYTDDINSALTDNINLNQVYKVEAFKTLERTIKIEYTLKYDQFKTHPKLIILPNSYIPYKTMKPIEIYKLLINEINKIKVRERILINLHDNDMLEDLKKFVNYLYADKFLKPIQIQLFKGIEPELSAQSNLNLVFKNKSSQDHQLIQIDIGEVIVEYRKPVYGCNGFNCYGKQIEHGEHDTKNLDLKIDEESIEIIENENNLILKSKKRGYVDYRDNKIAVNNVIKVDKINRIQTKITNTEDNDIEVHIAQNDIAEDSVGEGVELISERIHVSGHIGAHSLLEATELVVDGATHKDSVIFAKNALINRHKGTLRCHKATIKFLEGGKIDASYVEIGTCLGGSIFAKDVTIEHVKNHLTVYASNSITIKLISGEDNHFIIDYASIPIITSELNHIDAEIDNLKFKLEEESKKNGEKEKNIETRTQIQELKHKKDSIKNSTLNATITIINPLKGLNMIKFVLPNNEEIIHKTTSKKYETFRLQVDADKVTLHPIGTSKQH